MKEIFQFQFQHDYAFNQLFIHDFYDKEMDKQERIRQLICHILNVHHLWNARLLGTSPLSMDWDDLPYYSWEALNLENYRTSIDCIQNVDLQNDIHYTNSEGIAIEKKAWLIVTHILNHSNYHRAQLNLLLRQMGLAPIELNLISFKTEY